MLTKIVVEMISLQTTFLERMIVCQDHNQDGFSSSSSCFFSRFPSSSSSFSYFCLHCPIDRANASLPIYTQLTKLISEAGTSTDVANKLARSG